MVIGDRGIRKELAIDAAKKMLIAARTAPKGKGIDIIECAYVTDEDIEAVALELEAYNAETGYGFLLRDASNIRQADALVLIGTRPKVQGLNCGHCGFATCAEKPLPVPCELNSVDVGIAIGSACAAATDMRVDTRVMFSAGMAAQRLKMLGDEVEQVYAIPLSISSKNPFFDRASTRPAKS